MREIAYEWPECTVAFEPATGTVTTYYAAWQFSRVTPDDDDKMHAAALGITAAEHGLAHELAHHLLALHHGLGSSPIIWCAAHHYAPPTGADDEERGVHALVYRTHGRARPEDEPCYAAFAAAGVDIEELCAELRFLLAAARLPSSSHPRIRL